MTRKGLIFLLSGLILGASFGALILLSGATSQKRAVVGGNYQDLELTGLKKSTISLSQFSGKAVVLNFWATWCVPCQDEMPLLQKYSDLYPDKIVVIGVNSQESESTVTDYITRKNIHFLIALDQSGEEIRKFAIQGYPTTYFIDKTGVIRAEHIGQLREDLMQGYLASIGVQP